MLTKTTVIIGAMYTAPTMRQALERRQTETNAFHFFFAFLGMCHEGIYFPCKKALFFLISQ